MIKKENKFFNFEKLIYDIAFKEEEIEDEEKRSNQEANYA